MKKKGSKTEPQEEDIKGKPHNFVKLSAIIGQIRFSNPFLKSKKPHFAPYLIQFEILFDLGLPDIFMPFQYPLT